MVELKKFKKILETMWTFMWKYVEKNSKAQKNSENKLNYNSRKSFEFKKNIKKNFSGINFSLELRKKLRKSLEKFLSLKKFGKIPEIGKII